MKKGDIIVVNTFAGVDVSVKLLERIEIPKEKQWGGYGGWKTKLAYKEDVKKLQEAGVPILSEDESWIYDWQIIDNARHLDNAIKDCETEFEKEIELYKTYGGE